MSKNILDEFREMIACPQFGDGCYGSLGGLQLRLREKLREVYEYAKALESAELMDRATPKKCVNLKKFDSFISPANCPTCDTYLYEQFAYCPDCGQALKWEGKVNENSNDNR